MSDKLPPITASANITLAPMGLVATAVTYSPIADDHPYYPLIGRVTARWAQLERTLEVCTWQAMGVDQKTGSESTAKLIGAEKIMGLLAEELKKNGIFGVLEEKFDQLKIAILAGSAQRNRVTHDPWYVQGDGTTNQWRQEVPKKGLSFGFETVSESVLINVISNIDELIDQSWVFFKNIVDSRSKKVPEEDE